MTENIALIFQEVFTRIVRLRSGQHPTADVESFRYDAREAVKVAAAKARAAGYSIASGDGMDYVRNGTKGDIEMCTLATVAFLDESVAYCGDPMFAEWHKKPLTQEFFGHLRGGEYFFGNLDRLLARDDSSELADLLEVHYLCLLLGFAGGHQGDAGGLRTYETACWARIQRIRGKLDRLSPSAEAGAVARKAPANPMRPYAIAAIASLVATIVLFIVFKVWLGSGVSNLQTLAGGKV